MRRSGPIAVLTVFLITMAVVWASCSRSNRYRENDAVQSDYQQSYYSDAVSGGAQASPTRKLQVLGQPKKRLMVFAFWNDTPVQDDTVGKFVADELKRNLYTTQKVILPPQEDPAFSTMRFVQGNQIKVGQLIREGRKLGVGVLVVGRVSKIVFRQKGDEVGLLRRRQSGAAVDIEMKIFDVANGREVMAVARSGQASNSSLVVLESQTLQDREYRSEMVKLAVREAVTQLTGDVLLAVNKMAWEGRVAKIVGNKIYINAGRQSGLVGGDILKVLTPGDDIYDPATGAYLGRTHGQLKGTLEVADFIGDDGAVAEVHTGGNVQTGDVVRLY